MASENELKDKTVLFVNSGGKKKRFTLEAAKRLGCRVVLLGKDADVPKRLVDHYIEADTYDHREVLDRLQQFREERPSVRIDGAITFWEDDIPVLARITEQLNLPGNPLKTAINTRNKYEMRKRFQETGLGSPQFAAVKGPRDLAKAIAKVGFPAVMKPAWGADSEFVVLVKDEADAFATMQYLVKNCTESFNPIFKYNQGLFLYEEYVDGTEISIECFSQFGIPHVVGIHEKQPIAPPYFVENGDIAPARISDENYEEVCKLAESALIALGVKNSLSHIELKIGSKGCKLIEVASRMGGDDIYENVKHVWAEDLVKIGLQVACGVRVTHKKRDPKGCVICRYFIPSSSGIITNITGIQEVKKRRNVLELSLSKHVGDAVLVPPEGFDNMGWVITKGRTYQEAQSQMDWVFNTLDINVTRFSKGSSLGKTIRKDSLSSASLVRTQIMRAAKLGRIKVLDVDTLKRLHLGIIYNSSLPYDNNSMKARDIGEDIHRILLSRGYRVSLFDMNESPIPIHKLETAGLDFVLNLCEALHNSTHLESHAAALLDVFQLPYSGSGPATMSLCVDKISIKKLFHFHEIPTPAWDYVYSMEDNIRTDLQYPLIVKPANTDNSFGITNESVVTNREDLMRQIAEVVEGYRRPALIEEYIEGDEYDVCLLGNDDDVRVLPLIRSIFDKMPRGYWHIYGTESKSEKDGSAYNKIRIEKPAKIGEKLERLLTEISLDVFNLVNCRDYAKVEIRVDKTGNPYVLEVNPNPPIGRDYFFSWSSKLDGLDYEEMIEELLFTAVQRYRNSRLYFDLLEDN